MSIAGRRELVQSLSSRYRKGSRAEKGQILDEFTQAAGYCRKYAITLLLQPPKVSKRPRKRKRKRIYTPDVLRALVMVWEVSGRVCSKRLIPFLADFVEALERHGELVLEPLTRSLLLSMSVATADRLLAAVRRQRPRRGVSTTRPGTLLRHQIPIRTFADWTEKEPGFLEIDLVAHCGESLSGEYLNSLVLTDVHTGWTECVALLNRSERTVSAAIDSVRRRLPFPMRGIDSDNGSEFINHPLNRYCREHNITFTRCRPYKKNDQCHVEQKNGAIVRRIVGYDRYEGEDARKRLAAIYSQLRYFTNHFQTNLKLVSKVRNGAKATRKYDRAKTPYQRLQEAGVLTRSQARDMREQYELLNPAELARQIRKAQDLLWALSRVRNANEATAQLQSDS
jgi:hypothetical protein